MIVLCLNFPAVEGLGLSLIKYLEGQGDLVSRLIMGIAVVTT